MCIHFRLLVEFEFVQNIYSSNLRIRTCWCNLSMVVAHANQSNVSERLGHHVHSLIVSILPVPICHSARVFLLMLWFFYQSKVLHWSLKGIQLNPYLNPWRIHCYHHFENASYIFRLWIGNRHLGDHAYIYVLEILVLCLSGNRPTECWFVFFYTGVILN